MLRHVVLLEWKADISDEEIRAVEQELAALPAAIPQIRSYTFGRDAGLASSGNFDFALVADFDSQSDYLEYQNHPAHLRVIAERLRPAIATRSACQFLI